MKDQGQGMIGSQPSAVSKWWYWFAVIGRIAVGLVFVWAAVPKLIDPLTFARDIENYRIVEGTFAAEVAVWLPPFELFLGLSLITGFFARASSTICGLMLLGFMAAMISALTRGINLDCGCFGSATPTPVSIWTVLRNAGLATLCFLSLKVPSRTLPFFKPASAQA